MRITYPVMLLLLTSLQVFAQPDAPVEENFRRKGFIGISLGPAVPVGEFASKESDYNFSLGSAPRAATGLRLDLVNFGYRFSNTLGIAAKYYGGAHQLMLNNRLIGDYKPWGYGGIMAGPMVCIPLSQRVELDFRPMIGYSVARLPVYENSKSKITSEITAAYALSANLQFHLSQRIGMQFGLEYYHTKPTFDVQGKSYTQNISAISSTGGLFFRFN